MAQIRATDVIATKWATVTPQRSADYEFGINNPRTDWAAATTAASDAWKAGVQEAIAKNRFSAGVKSAGTGKWQRGSIEKGLARWGPGVQLGRQAYEDGFAPYQAAIKAVNLPPRFARRDPRNLDRVKAIVDALIATKNKLSGG